MWALIKESTLNNIATVIDSMSGGKNKYNELSQATEQARVARWSTQTNSTESGCKGRARC